MLSKINRIKDKELFPKILKSGKKFYCPYFILAVQTKINGHKILIEKTNHPQFAFITSKKVGGAVARNKVRRVFSEIVASELPNIDADTRAIFIGHKNAVECEFSVLKAEIKKQLGNAGLIKNPI